MQAMIDETRKTAAVPVVEQAAARGNYWKIGLILLAALGLNLLVLAIPAGWIESLRGYGLLGYLAAFGITALANASVVVPIPYPGLIALLARVLGNPWGVALAGAAGSTLGETTAFFVGRAGKTAVEDTRFYRWVKHQLRTPLRAFVVLFLLSAPPNPFFDVAGLTAGSLGVPFWIFAVATFLGRILKMLFFAGLGQQLLP
jgi:membrane protein YqaA with SNARE-associated domain